MEEFRPLVVDAVVLWALNKRLWTPEDFVTEPLSDAVNLTTEGRKTFLRHHQPKSLLGIETGRFENLPC